MCIANCNELTAARLTVSAGGHADSTQRAADELLPATAHLAIETKRAAGSARVPDEEPAKSHRLQHEGAATNILSHTHKYIAEKRNANTIVAPGAAVV